MNHHNLIGAKQKHVRDASVRISEYRNNKNDPLLSHSIHELERVKKTD